MARHHDFVHLHLHSEYSLLDGAISFSRLGEAVREMGMPAVAVTDHGCLFGAVEFQKKITNAGVRPILGMEAYLTPGSRHDRTYRPGARPYFHLTLLAGDAEGYRNICRLSSIGYLEGFYYKPRIDRESLESFPDGLLIGSACLQGEIAQHLLRGDRDAARDCVRYYQELVGRERFFIELMDHGLEDEKRILQDLVELARETEAVLVATNDAHYLKKSHCRAHEVLLCLQTQKRLEDTDRMRFGTDEFYVKSPAEMETLFSWVPESLVNTIRIAEQCHFDPGETVPLLLPEYPIPSDSGCETMDDYLRKLAFEGLADRLGRDLQSGETGRLDAELSVIRDMGFPGYFLIVSELRNWAASKSIPMGPGRGSGAGSLVSFAVGITDINPLEHGLSFERFLNPSRREMPDFDIDFCYERRGEVIDHIIEVYGRDSVCQIITFNRMKARMAIRDVARVMGMTYEEGDELAKMVGRAQTPDPSIAELLEEVPDLRSRADRDQSVRQLLDHCEVLENKARNSSVHAAGVIIAPGDLRDYVPLYLSGSGEVTTQFENHAEQVRKAVQEQLPDILKDLAIHSLGDALDKHWPKLEERLKTIDPKLDTVDVKAWLEATLTRLHEENIAELAVHLQSVSTLLDAVREQNNRLRGPLLKSWRWLRGSLVKVGETAPRREMPTENHALGSQPGCGARFQRAPHACATHCPHPTTPRP